MNNSIMPANILNILDILACPSPDHAPLELQQTEGGAELVCTACRSRFDIRDGIPVLLPDEARPGPRGLGIAVTGADLP
jgi:uncharacterized protein YbaR (Trm112 family)